MNITFITIITCCVILSDAVDVIFLLTTPESPKTRHVFSKGNYSNLVFNTKRQYKFLCHGIMSNENIPWYTNFTTEYMKKGNVNVVAVGYEKAVANLIYFPSIFNVPTISKVIADLILDLNKSKNISLNNIHLIGYSLGGQIVGVTGKILKSSKKIIGRITGLDPAGPGFDFPFFPYNTNIGISRGDANHVDIIHSSIVGVNKPIGDVDFFPNGGLNQPGCKHNPYYNHPMAFIYFYFSISEIKFVGYKCKDYSVFKKGKCKNADIALMGEPLKADSKGVFYLDTDPELIKRACVEYLDPSVCE